MAIHLKTWYAVYCRSRYEKKAYEQLIKSGIEAFLPLVKTIRQWSDRRKWVEEPLFRSYLFVNIVQKEYLKVLNTPGVVKFITFEGEAVPVPPKQITAIRRFLDTESDHNLSYDNIAVGDVVEIQRGSLMGLKGNLVEIQGKKKVRIEIEAIGKSIFLTVPRSYLKIG